jgi:hypothetical protein
MNFSHARSWPHPVVSPLTDDVAPNSFDFQLDVLPGDRRWLLGVQVIFEDATLSSHVAAGKAAYVLHVECKRTYFRKAFRSENANFEVEIPEDSLFGLVEVSLLIVAIADLKEYRHPGQHLDYRNASFEVSIAQPLAVAPSKRFEAFLEADPILKLASILDIKKGEDGLRVMKVNCEGDRIVVILPPSDYVRYRDLRADPAIRGLLASTVVLPAVLEALHYLRNPELDIQDFKENHKWSRSVLRRLEVSGHDFMNTQSGSEACLEAAQALLREPLRRGLEDLKELFTTPRT